MAKPAIHILVSCELVLFKAIMGIILKISVNRNAA
jgi:hypothetical protein